MTPSDWQAAITMLLLITFALTVHYLTSITMTSAALLGVPVVIVLNVVYWKWRGVPVREVYSLD